jgi:Zn-dependent metalloprotease/uncharacterized membrane protein
MKTEFRFKHIFFISLLFLLPFTGMSQIYRDAEAAAIVKGASLLKISEERKSIDFYKPGNTQQISEANHLNWLRDELLQVSQTEELRLEKTERDLNGYTHYRYQQFYNGLKVEHGVYYVHVKNGYVTTANGEWYINIMAQTSPALTRDAAFSKALAAVPSEKYNDHADNGLQGAKDNGELLIYHQKDRSRLAYKFDIYSEIPLKRVFIYIDAQTGETLAEIDRICTTDVPATAVTAYNGTRTMTTDSISPGNYRLKADIGFGGVRTLDLNNGTSYATAVEFTDADNLWNATGIDKYAYDAHFGTEATHEFYLTNFGRNSYDNAGAQMVSYVHYSNGYVNAFWNGNYMTYGDGDGVDFTPLTSLDIVGHEITHAVTQFSAALVYANESGALNESFSDCFGVTIDFFKNPTTANFLEGDQVNVSGIPFRNMADPNQYDHPDTYLGNFWSSAGAVHTNSGVMNHWYYLLCQGGSGTNDNGDSYSIIPIGMDHASEIAYRNLTVYLTPNATYADARFYAIQSAIDLFGSCSDEEIQVTNAWYAVGVGGLFSNAVVAQFGSNNNFLCTVPGTVNFINQSTNGLSYLWDFGDGNTSTQTAPSHTYTTAGTYTVELITYGTGLCGTSDTITKLNYITVTNGGGPVSASCSPITLSYCCNAGITNVTFGTINNTSPDASEGFKDFTCGTATTITAGDPVTVSITTGIGGTEDVRMWIDYNNDGSFNNTNEQVFISDNKTGNHTGIVQTPITAVLNTPLRMRVIDDVAANTITSACYDPANGQAEDYTITFIANSLPPVADFIADQVSVPVGTTVNFTDLTINAPTAWSWTFTGAATTSSTNQNPSIVYNVAGIYPVTLTASNGFGNNTITKTAYIEVVTTVNMCGGTTTISSQTGELYDSGGPLGGYQNSENCSLIIAPPCANSVTLSFQTFVTQASDILYVHNGDQLTDPIILTASGSNIPANVTANSGKMLIRWVSNSSTTFAGYYATWTSVIGSQIPTVANWNVPSFNPPFGIPVPFTDASTNAPESWIWDFGDGATSTLQNPSHAYFAAGVFPVTLIVSNCVSTDTLTQNITVQAMPHIEVNPDSIGVSLNCNDSVTVSYTIYNTGTGDLVYSTTGGSFTDSVNVLSMTHGVDLSTEYPNTLTAINNYFTKYNLTTSSTTDSAVFSSLLAGKDLVLFPEQESGTITQYPLFTSAIQNFMNNGGVALVLGSVGSGSQDRVYTMNMFTGNYMTNANTGTMTVTDTTHEYMENIPLTVAAVNATFYHNFTNPDKETLIIHNTGDVLSYRNIGAGRAVFLGFDYFASSAQTQRIIANIIENSRLNALPPWVQTTSSSDTIAPGDSVVVYLTFNSSGLTAGVYTSQVVINSNDTANSPLIIPITLTVAGDPLMTVSDTCLQFGQLGQYLSATQNLTFGNNGCDTLQITSITPGNSAYSVNPSSLSIAPGATQSVAVTFNPQTAGTFNSFLDVQSNDVDTLICLTGTSTLAPQILTVPDSIQVNLDACSDSVTIPLWVYNTGGPDLIFNTSGNNVTDTVRVLALTQGVDLTGEYPNTIASINAYFTKYTITTSTTTDASVLTGLLNGIDLLLMPEQETGTSTHYPSFAPVVQNFMNAGGVVVVLGSVGGGSTDRIYDMGMFTGSFFSTSNSGTINILDTTHAYMENIPLTIPAPNATFYHSFTNPDKITLAAVNSNDIISYRNIGSGRGVFLGFDYFAFNASTQRIIANIIQNGNSTTLSPWIQLSGYLDTITPGDSTLIYVTLNSGQLAAGTYSSYLIINSNDPLNPVDSIYISMNVSGNPCAIFTYAVAGTCSGTVSFTDESVNNATSWNWDFGDGGTSTLANPTHTYISAGVYPVQLVACNALGCDSITVTVTITGVNGPSSALCTPATSGYCCNAGIMNVTFNTINNTSGNGIQGYQDYSCAYATTVTQGASYPISVTTGASSNEYVRCWIDYNNDGIFSTAENVFGSLAIANHNGSITIPLTTVLNTPLRMRVGSDRSVNNVPSPCVNAVNGQFEDYSVTIVSNNLPPVALAAIDSIDSCNGIVSFEDGSNNLPTSWLWYFGDGQTSTVQNPTHQYTSSGVYQVSLVASNAFGSDSTTISVTVSVVSAAFTVSGLQQIGQSLQFTAATQTAATYLWNFGDGFLSTLVNPTHTYTAAGSYPVTLTVTSGSCVVTLTDTIVILPVGIDFPEGVTYLSLLPNPFKDDITIEFVLDGEREISLQINDVLGRVVKEYARDSKFASGKHTFKFTGDAPGAYMMIFHIDGVPFTQRILKIK